MIANKYTVNEVVLRMRSDFKKSNLNKEDFFNEWFEEILSIQFTDNEIDEIQDLF